ncbi:hypothetical protein LIS83_29360 (plasmid) [Bacillus anthracis]|uniref:hypothetical protein n=1 Tax=Bacillus anthracis TaxID=1392 RepID=UPI00207ABC59|nr:hypothetical protein [Bacillus anthracis]USL05523.1 hypothetical protein LIS83_29360 [Bacillus anthracis]
MTVTNFQVIGGRMEFKYLNLELYKSDIKKFMVFKAQTWLNMLKEGKIPTKWSRVFKKGIKVSFEYAKSQEEMDKAQDDFRAYIQQVNEEYDLDLVITVN